MQGTQRHEVIIISGDNFINKHKPKKRLHPSPSLAEPGGRRCPAPGQQFECCGFHIAPHRVQPGLPDLGQSLPPLCSAVGRGLAPTSPSAVPADTPPGLSLNSKEIVKLKLTEETTSQAAAGRLNAHSMHGALRPSGNVFWAGEGRVAPACSVPGKVGRRGTPSSAPTSLLLAPAFLHPTNPAAKYWRRRIDKPVTSLQLHHRQQRLASSSEQLHHRGASSLAPFHHHQVTNALSVSQTGADRGLMPQPFLPATSSAAKEEQPWVSRSLPREPGHKIPPVPKGKVSSSCSLGCSPGAPHVLGQSRLTAARLSSSPRDGVLCPRHIVYRRPRTPGTRAAAAEGQQQLTRAPREISLYGNVMKIIQLIYFNNPTPGPLRAADRIIIFKILAVISDQA